MKVYINVTPKRDKSVTYALLMSHEKWDKFTKTFVCSGLNKSLRKLYTLNVTFMYHISIIQIHVSRICVTLTYTISFSTDIAN